MDTGRRIVEFGNGAEGIARGCVREDIERRAGVAGPTRASPSRVQICGVGFLPLRQAQLRDGIRELDPRGEVYRHVPRAGVQPEDDWPVLIYNITVARSWQPYAR